MKKTILAITLFIGFVSAAMAAGNNRDAKLLDELKATLKNSYPVARVSTDAYSKASFVFNGLAVSAYYYASDEELVGFFVTQTSTPKEIESAIQKSYSNWTLMETQMFIDPYGNINYFTLVEKNKHQLILKATSAGNLSVFTKVK